MFTQIQTITTNLKISRVSCWPLKTIYGLQVKKVSSIEKSDTLKWAQDDQRVIKDTFWLFLRFA